jgi:hypothetical protein
MFLIVYFNPSKFFIQLFPIFVPESSAGFMSYIVHILSVFLSWILQPLQFSLLPLSK